MVRQTYERGEAQAKFNGILEKNFIKEGIRVTRSKRVNDCCMLTLQAKHVAVLKVLDKVAATAEYGGKKVVNTGNLG